MSHGLTSADIEQLKGSAGDGLYGDGAMVVMKGPTPSSRC